MQLFIHYSGGAATATCFRGDSSLKVPSGQYTGQPMPLLCGSEHTGLE